MVKTRARNIKYWLYGGLLTAFAALLIADPSRYIAVCMDGIKMWAACVLPSLFPFMVICALLTNTGIAAKASLPLAKFTKIFNLPYAAAPCLLMGIVSGYPAGSRTVGEFFKSSYTDTYGAKKLACLCSACGPLFAIGTVGTAMFESTECGVKLFLAHAFSVIAVGIIYSLLTPPAGGKIIEPQFKGDVLKESFCGAAEAAITAGAFIVFFYTAAAVIDDLHVLYPLERLICLFAGENAAEAVCTGLIEMTGGCRALALSESYFALPLAGFLITFGGACIILQQLCYLTKAGVKPAAFILQKFIQGVLCFLILLIIQ